MEGHSAVSGWMEMISELDISKEEEGDWAVITDLLKANCAFQYEKLALKSDDRSTKKYLFCIRIVGTILK